MHLHILGICGTFMGGIAALAQAAGHRVTGSDAAVYPPMSDQLAAFRCAEFPFIKGWSRYFISVHFQQIFSQRRQFKCCDRNISMSVDCVFQCGS